MLVPGCVYFVVCCRVLPATEPASWYLDDSDSSDEDRRHIESNKHGYHTGKRYPLGRMYASSPPPAKAEKMSKDHRSPSQKVIFGLFQLKGRQFCVFFYYICSFVNNHIACIIYDIKLNILH